MADRAVIDYHTSVQPRPPTPMDPGSLLRGADAHLEAAAALHRLVKAMKEVDQPTPPPEPPPSVTANQEAEPPPEPAPTGWITDRVPEAGDGDSDGEVRIPSRIDRLGVWVHWSIVYPGTPWAPGDATPAVPWDPTTLDRNGWIRSRLPTEGDASKDRGKWVLVPQGKERRTCQEYAVIVPGQHWAPWGSDPGIYQP